MRFHVGLVLVLLGCGAMTACPGLGKPKDPAAQQDAAQTKPQEIVIPVSAERPRRGDISEYFSTDGNIEAERKVAVTSEAVGICERVLVDEGDVVKKDDVLAELDKEEADATLKTAQAQLNKQRADYERFKKGREKYGEEFISDIDFDSVYFNYEQGKANFDMQQVKLKNLTIRAPIDGVVIEKRIQVGMLVTTGTPVFNLVDPDSYMLVINVPEKYLSRLQIGQLAKVGIDALKGQEFAATIRRINPGIEAASGTVKVTLDFDPETRKQLFDSAYARVRLVMETHQNALLLPRDAVMEENSRDYVFLVREVEKGQEEPGGTATDASRPAERPAGADVTQGSSGAEGSQEPGETRADEPRFVAERVEVQTGLEDSDSVEILSGIDEEALVVTLGQQTLKTGSPVKPTDAGAELQQAASKTTEEALAAAKEKREKGVDVRPFEGHP